MHDFQKRTAQGERLSVMRIPKTFLFPGVAAFAALSAMQPAQGALVLVDFNGQYFANAPYNPPPVTASLGPLSASDPSVTGSSMAATADYGSLLVNTASSSSSNTSNTSVTGTAAWQDFVTILGGTGQGRLKLNFAFTGSLGASDTGGSSSGTTDYAINATINSMSASLRAGSLTSNGGPAGLAIQSFSISDILFPFGTAFGFDVELAAGSFAVGDVVNPGGPYTGTSGASNLLLTLTSIEVFNIGGAAVSGATLSSQSGFGYGLVPEPSRTILAIAGFALIGLRRRR
jgi:hypothetical protein